MEFLILLYARVYFPCFKFLHYYALTGLREISVLCSPGFDGHPGYLLANLKGNMFPIRTCVLTSPGQRQITIDSMTSYRKNIKLSRL